jgi:hypothetical protein
METCSNFIVLIFQIVLAAVVAVASTQYGGHLGSAYGLGQGGYGSYGYGYSGPLANVYPADLLPASARGLVQHYNGAVTPVDTPSVQAARADHLHAKSHAYASHGYGHGGYGLYKREADAQYSHPAIGGYSVHGYRLANVLPAGTNSLVAHYNGAVTPRDTPFVQAACASHLSAKSHAYASHSYGTGGYGIYKREADGRYSHPAFGVYSVHGYPLTVEGSYQCLYDACGRCLLPRPHVYPAGTNGLVAYYNGGYY